MLTWFIFTLLKYLLLSTICIVVYCLYLFIYKPWSIRKYYKQFDNVEVTDKYYPVLGDFGKAKQRIAVGEYQLWDYNETILERPNKDMKLFQFGTHSHVDLLTIRALEEFEKLVPESIDRFHLNHYPIWYGTRGSLLLHPSTEYWKERRTSSLKLLGINQISEYLPVMFESGNTVLDTWKSNEHINFSLKCKSISFRVISGMLFGGDYYLQKASLKYIDVLTSEVSELEYEEFLVKIIGDGAALFRDQFGYVFPFIKKYSLMNPYKAMMQNSITLYEAVKNFGDKSKDENSLFHKLLKLGTVKKEDIYCDIVGLIMAGMDTTSDTIASTLYFLKKFPEVQKKLKKELDTIGLDILKKKELTREEVKDIHTKLLECDYLNYVIKETLRIDSAGAWSIMYGTKKPVNICQVDIPKDSKIRVYGLGPNQDVNQWHKPREYIPDRFNPESEYFFKPNEPDKTRHPKSWIPFSTGMRTGPGKALAIYEAKAIIARFMYHMEYEIDEDLLKNDKVQFSMTSQLHVEGKLINKLF